MIRDALWTVTLAYELSGSFMAVESFFNSNGTRVVMSAYGY